MTSTELIQRILLYLCWAVVIIRFPAVRSSSQRPLWCALLMLGLGMSALQKSTSQYVRYLGIDVDVLNLVSSLMAVGVATILLTFATRAQQLNPSETLPFSRLRRISCAVTVMVMIAGFSTVKLLKIPTQTRFLPVSGGFTVHTVYWLTYLAYMLVATIVTVALLICACSRINSRLVQIPIVLLAVGELAFTVFLGSRLVALFTSVDPLVAFGTYVSSVHTAGVALGCSIAAFMPVFQGFIMWKNGNMLYPLWRTLITAAPQVVLYSPRSRLVDMLVPQNSRLRLRRRLVEIRDVLLILRDWVTSSDVDHIRAVVAESEIPADQVAAVTTACWLKVALAARDVGQQRVEEPLDLVRQGGIDEETELDWLREVAAAWSSPLVAQCASAVSLHRGTDNSV